MSETAENSGLGSVVALIAETLTKEVITAEAPKWESAIQKDIDALGDLHVIKKEFLRIVLEVIKDAQALADQ